MALVGALLLIVAGAAASVTILTTAIGMFGLARRCNTLVVLCLVLWAVFFLA